MVDIDASVEILLVEDNPTDSELCIRALKKHNLANKLLWIKGGSEALDVLFQTGSFAGRPANNNPKVLLLDLHLPKIDGLDILRKVRADERTKTNSIVVLASSKESADMAEAYKLRRQQLHHQTGRVQFLC